MGNIIGAIILGIISLVCVFVGFRQLREKDFLFNNAYLYATKEERQNMNKKPYYRQSGIVFILLGVIFAITAVEMFLMADWLFYLAIIVAVITVAYAIASSVRMEQSKKKWIGIDEV